MTKWYVIKVANAKSKIQKYQITDPSLKMFVYKYEDSVPWDQIKNQDDIQQFIHGHLLRNLFSYVNPKSENNFYMKPTDIDIEEEYQNNPNDPQLQQAIQVYRQNPEQATQSILKFINDGKHKGFMQWWNHLTKEKLEYADNPAFVYSVFKPIIDSSPPDQKSGPPPLEEKALEQIWQEINEQGSTNINVLKQYKKNADSIDRIGAQVVESTGRGQWVRIDSKNRDPKNFKKNVEKLTRYSQGQGWCTGYGMAEPYLSRGDFWLYIEGGKPFVAIRLEGEKNVAEIRGRFNLPQHLNPYWQEVEHFLTQGFPGLNYLENSTYQDILKMKNINQDIASGDPEKIDGMMEMIQNDPKNYQILSPENKKAHPEFLEKAASVYSSRLESRLVRIRQFKTNNNVYREEYSQLLETYQGIPNEVRKELSSKLNTQIAEVHKDIFMNDPTIWGEFTPEIKKMISPSDQVVAWENYIKQDPYRYNNFLIPKNIREQMPKEWIAERFMELVRISPNHYDHIPNDIRALLPQDETHKILIDDFKRYPLSQDTKGYSALRRIEGILPEEEIVDTYRQVIQTKPSLFSYIPPKYRNLVYQQTGNGDVLLQQKARIAKQPHIMGTLPAEVQQGLMQNYGPEIARIFANIKIQFGANIDAYWRTVPDIVKPSLPENLKAEVLQYYQSYVIKNPKMIDKVPPDLKPSIRLSGNWFHQLFKEAEMCIGYKVVGFDPVTKQAYSFYGGRGMPVNLRIGKWVQANSDMGLYLGSSKQYVLDHYSGFSDDPELLLTYQFDGNDTLGGAPGDHLIAEGEIRVSSAKLIDIEEIQKEKGSRGSGTIPFSAKKYGMTDPWNSIMGDHYELV